MLCVCVYIYVCVCAFADALFYISADNSEYARNGDYSPNRLKAMVEAANYVCSAKLQSHPDTAVGLLTMAGKRYGSKLPFFLLVALLSLCKSGKLTRCCVFLLVCALSL